MLKKSLLIGSAVLLASSPLLIAQKDILIFGNDTLAGGQNVSVSGNDNYWSGENTGVSIISNSAAGVVTDVPGVSRLSEKESWDPMSQAFSILADATGIKSKDELDGITGGALYKAEHAPVLLQFSGFNPGQQYEITLWVKTVGAANHTDVRIDLTRQDGVIDGTVFYGLYNMQQGAENGFGDTIVLNRQGDYAIRYSFTAGTGAHLNINFAKHDTGSDGAKFRPFFGIGLIAIAAVPEPSAFGLLAGVGALALTVSRRKRSRRS